jgi:uncharacterized protein (TIGR00159 family)
VAQNHSASFASVLFRDVQNGCFAEPARSYQKELLPAGQCSYNLSDLLVPIHQLGCLKLCAENKGIYLDVNEVATACFNMSATKTGALIVIARKTDLKLYVNSGDSIDSALNARMLENIFFKNSPLHDGAVIISDNRIVAARCVLPVTEKENFPAHYGMRHRAAVGITENTDAVAVSVSEQTGGVSLTVAGEINPQLTKEKLIFLLEKSLDI